MGDWLRLYQAWRCPPTQSMSTFNQILCNHKQFKHLKPVIKPFSSYFNSIKINNRLAISREGRTARSQLITKATKVTTKPTLTTATTGNIICHSSSPLPSFTLGKVKCNPLVSTKSTASVQPQFTATSSSNDSFDLIQSKQTGASKLSTTPRTSFAEISDRSRVESVYGAIDADRKALRSINGIKLNDSSEIKEMGLMQSKNHSRVNGCACTYSVYEQHKICGSSSPSATPYRTTVFSGNPYYSKVNNNFVGKRWFSIDSSKMSDKQLTGMDLLKDNRLNKDLSFTMRERDQYRLRGLLPATIRGQKLEAEAAMLYLNSLESNMTKYQFLRELQDRNERLFYRLLCEHTEALMPLVYTPVVGEACIKYSRIFQRPRGMYITVHDSGNISNILANWPERDVKAIVVTDGERILGLGDLGANGMGIPVGKLSLYTALAGIPPQLTLPVTLDTGTDNQELLNDPFYIGLKQKRVRGPQYDDLIEEFMEAVIKRWGRSCLIQFEDFGNRNAFRLLEKYKENYCTFNDDIQGTASVCVAGILAGCRITGMKMSQQKFLFFGAGEAALGTANLLVMAMEKEGTPTEEARDRIWLMDSRGLVVTDREGGLDHEKIKFAKKARHTKNLEDIVNMVQPTALIGVAAQPKAFNERILRKMGELNKHPLIFPLSNPTSKAECTAEEAYKATEGRCVFASGSPFDPVEINGKIFHPGQGNNAYIFPGISLAAIACGVHTIPDESFLIASKALAEQVTDADLAEGRVYPPLADIREVSLILAAKVAQYFYVESLATVRPEPEDKLLFMKTLQYDYSYD